jgi:hypothetical protein
MRQQINLYDPALRARREWLTAKWLLNGLGVMIVVLGLYGGELRWENQRLTEEANRVGAELAQRQAEVARLEEELARSKVGSETEAALRQAEAALQARERVREALDSGALGSSEGFAEFLRAFARQARDGLWMVGLQMAEGGRSITLEGRTLDPDRIPGYIRGLNGEPMLRGRSFEAMSVRLVGEDEKPATARPASGDAAVGGQAADAKQPPYHEFFLTAFASRAAADNAAGEAERR